MSIRKAEETLLNYYQKKVDICTNCKECEYCKKNDDVVTRIDINRMIEKLGDKYEDHLNFLIINCYDIRMHITIDEVKNIAELQRNLMISDFKKKMRNFRDNRAPK
jgi:hypothetical protein